MLVEADQARAQQPLKGVVLCCTSVRSEQRDELAKWASDMGAAHKYDLTSDVTHLVVGNVDTEKYKYVAKERIDVTVVLPSWVHAVHQSWLQGGETNVEYLEEKYRAPVLHGLHVTITGFGDVSERKGLEDTVTAHGAQYYGDLTKATTHLIAATPSGKKFEVARGWSTKTVSPEWLADSIERGMALDEKLYDPILPRERRGVGAFKKSATNTAPLSKRLREAADGWEGKRKLRRTASAKLGTQNAADLNAIVSGRFGIERDNPWQEIMPTASVCGLRTGTTLVQPDHFHDHEYKQNVGCFNGRIIYVHGFDSTKTKTLQHTLSSLGAQVAASFEVLGSYNDSELDSGFLITPYNAHYKLDDLPTVAEGLTRTNELWVEQCQYRNRIIDPLNEVIYKPFPQLNIGGFDGLTVALTGFVDFDRLHIIKAVRLMGRHGLEDQRACPGVSTAVAESLKHAHFADTVVPLRESTSGGGQHADIATIRLLPAVVPDEDPAPPYTSENVAARWKHLQEMPKSDANAPRKAMLVQPKLRKQRPRIPPMCKVASSEVNNSIVALLAQKKRKRGRSPIPDNPENRSKVSSSDRQRRRQLQQRQFAHAISATDTMTTVVECGAEFSGLGAPLPRTDMPPGASQSLEWGDDDDRKKQAALIRLLGGNVDESLRIMGRINRVTGAEPVAMDGLRSRIMTRKMTAGGNMRYKPITPR